MSRENVEIDQATFKAWNAGDMDALRELYGPDIIMRAPEGWPEPGPFVGREAVMRQLEQMRETWDADAVELITRKPSKPSGCRSKTLTPTPEAAGYCAGDVAGER